MLVHGLWMRGWVMAWLGWRLRRCGFRTVVFSYPSIRGTLTDNALRLARFVSGLDASRVHFVGHSLGGLVVLQMMATHLDTRTGRVVLAGSPYCGSYVANKLAQSRIGRILIGRSVLQWISQTTPSVGKQAEIGVIAGCKAIGMGCFVGGLTQPSDGVVFVAETPLPVACDQILLDVTHSGMLVSSQVARQTCRFLQQGKFLHEEKSG